MTAEVAVLNRIGVALAADSAVTVGANADKIYSSADKLFSLSHSAPVGVMIYGAAMLMGMPWETIIKTYRSDLALRYPTGLPKLAEYMEDMKRFLADQSAMFDADRQKRHFLGYIDGFLRHIVETIRRGLDEEIRKRAGRKSKSGISRDEGIAISAKILERELKSFSKLKRGRGITDEVQRAVVEKFRPEAEEIYERLLKAFPISEEDKERLLAVSVDLLVKPEAGGGMSGLVIAGFGEAEFMPSAICIETDGVIEGSLRYVQKQESAIGEQNSATVMPFAQSDMVNVFMEGIEPTLKHQMKDSIPRLLGGVADELKKHPKLSGETEFVDQFRTEMDQLAKGYTEELERQIRETFIGPVLGVVASLPKEELGATAEALVNLTKFRRRATNVRETVGGPIDVALITKGDGFIWVRRKHYFDPGLNPRAMARFQKEGQT